MITNTYKIENGIIERSISVSDGKISGISFTAKRCGKTLSLPSGSEEFSLVLKQGFRKITLDSHSLSISSVEEKQENDLSTLIFRFDDVAAADSLINIALIYKIGETKHYLKKHIEISYKKQGKKKLVLDNICFEKIVLPQGLNLWSVPDQKNSHIPAFALSLGQPVYIDRFFLGCEFPAALNNIESSVAQVRYFSGKPLRELTSEGKYVSYASVLGCGEGEIFQQVQKAFFAYIKDISKPVRLRRQYNSWYDHMLNITHENVAASFLEIDKGLTVSGEKVLDSFVADDGWNDYGKGFWSFNDKFPRELYPFSALAKSLGSEFGLWVGPRGGYTTDTIKFARQIQKAGNGYVNKSSMDICVASEKYVNKMNEMMCDFEKRFDLNYFKLDGFAQRPCKNRRHDHMTGGYKNAYFYTDVWEKWLRVFENLSNSGGESFWINLTCYAAPSPWYLQWVNSLWMQISDDVGFIGDKNKVSDKDRMLSYRDEKYFDFYRTRQFQFPQRALYNHDPIYGNEAKVSMSDDEFRSYLFTMAARGTAFWELYYSYNMMNESKWRINYSVLRFIEKNTDVLSNSVIFGSRPSENGVYGYSCFNEKEGIVALRNSGGKKQTFNFRLDEKIGVGKGFGKADTYILLPYTEKAYTGAYGYGDSVTVELQPYETKIFHSGKRAEPLECIYVKARNRNTAEIQFNQTVDISRLACKESPIKKAELLADYMTVKIEFENDFAPMNEIALSQVCDIMGNKADISLAFTYYPDKEALRLYGDGDFAIRATVGAADNQLLFRQGDEVMLSLEEGFAVFRVGGYSIKSSHPVSKGDTVCAVRERNNVLKLYINGKLDCGMLSEPLDLISEDVQLNESSSVEIYNRSLSFDEAK